MYLIYSDEAGTSGNEAVTIVASYVVAEKDIRSAIQFVDDLFNEYVPEKYRSQFEFHAYKVWGDPSYRDEWTMERRADLIGAMAAVPRLCNGSITIGKARRDSAMPKEIVSVISKADFDHFTAFTAMIRRADKYVRDCGPEGSLAIVVAEDVPEKRKFMRLALNFARNVDLDIPIDDVYIQLTSEEKATGKITQTNPGRAQRIIDTVHFATREAAVLLQVADACAFVFRRYLNSQSRGEEWVEAMLGYPLDWHDWQGPSSAVSFRFHLDRH